MAIKSKSDFDKEWVALMQDAKKLNLTPAEIRNYLQQTSSQNKRSKLNTH